MLWLRTACASANRGPAAECCGQCDRPAVLGSGTSVGANCEEAKAAQSRADFVNKMNLALKEARETHYWLRLIGDAHMLPQRRLAELLNESDEIVRILTATVRKSKRVG